MLGTMQFFKNIFDLQLVESRDVGAMESAKIESQPTVCVCTRTREVYSRGPAT
jgi:hypothetical protein